MKIRRVGAELYHAEGRTYITTLVVALHNIAECLTSSTRRNPALRACVCVCVYVCVRVSVYIEVNLYVLFKTYVSLYISRYCIYVRVLICAYVSNSKVSRNRLRFKPILS